MIITLFSDVRATTAWEYDIDLQQLWSRLSNPIVYASKVDLPLLKLAKFGSNLTSKGSYRHDANIEYCTGVECDYDAGEIPFDDAISRLNAAGIYAYLYTSPSYSESTPRWRVIAPFSSPQAPECRFECVGKINAVFGGELALESFTLSQSFYFGAVSGVEYRCGYSLGVTVDHSQITPLYHSRRTQGGSSDYKAISEIIIDQTLIDDIVSALRYIPSDDRVTWINVGQNLKCLGQLGYDIWVEWSKTCPTKFNEADMPERFAGFSGDRSDYRAIFTKATPAGWKNPMHERKAAQQLKHFTEATTADNEQSLVTSYLPFEVPMDKYLVPHRNERGTKTLATIENLEYLLRSYGISYYYDELLKKREIVYPDNYREDISDLTNTATLDRIRSLCALNSIPMETSNMLDAILSKRVVNPIHQWITSRPWDGQDRMQVYFDSVLVAKDDRAYRNSILKLWALQCVAAADSAKSSPRYDKIAKYEYMLVFSSKQGRRKSTWITSLVPIEYRDYIKTNQMLNLNDKDSIKIATSAWLTELGELDSTFRRSDIAQLKAFLSKTVDTMRLAYDRAYNDYVRRTSFFATVNEIRFLLDDTGNRRFLPLIVIGTNMLYDRDFDKQQFWAQIWHEYINGAAWWPDDELIAQLHDRQEEHRMPDPIEDGMLKKFDLSNIAPKLAKVWTCTEILAELGNQKPTKYELNTVSKVLERHGFKQAVRRDKTTPRGYCVALRMHHQ